MRRKPAAGEDKTALDNTPDLTPFTSPFNYVKIITIHNLAIYKAAFSNHENSRFIFMCRGVYSGIDEVLQ